MRRKRLLWTLWLAIAAGGIALGVWLYVQLRLTPPTALSLDPENLAVLSPPVISPPIVRQAGGDGGADYRAALAAYDADACDAFAKNPAGDPPKSMQLVLNAADKTTMDLLAENPGQIINYQSEHPALENLEQLGRAMDRAGLMLRLKKQTQPARQYFQAVYGLGSALYAERLCYDEYLKGMGLMDEAATGLAELEDQPRRSQLQQHVAAMVDYDAQKVRPIYEALYSADPDESAVHAGDVFVFAAKSRERMFRVEAILALGRMRFSAERNADQRAAGRDRKSVV